MRHHLAPAAGILLALTACSSSGDDQVCAAVISYAGPVLTIAEATTSDGRPVGTLVLESVEIDGRTQDRDDLLQLTLGDHRNVALDGDTVTCRVPCGLGTDGGRWRLTVSAPGGGRSVVETSPSYATASGCGPTLSDGTEISVVLDPA